MKAIKFLLGHGAILQIASALKSEYTRGIHL